MLKETGIVIGVVNELAQVQTRNQMACSSCKVSESCGNGIIEKYLSGKLFVSELPNTVNAKVGQQVVIEIPKSRVTKASLIVYFIPLLGLFVGSMVAVTIGLSENQTIIFALLGLIIGMFVTKYYNRKWLKHELYSPKIVSIIDDPLDPTR